MPIPITGLFTPSGGADAFDLVSWHDVASHNWVATTAPGTGDDSADGYVVGSLWCDTTHDKAYVCLDNTVGAAVWTEITGAGGAGTIGPMGPPGVDGVDGADGYPIPGPAGAAGAAGASITGQMGPPGCDGQDGLDGWPIPGPAGAAGAGGAMATDPLWAAAGDIAIGTANDQGEILTVSIPGAANLLSVVGTVNGDTKPGYKVLFDGTAPEPVGTAAAGTGVVAAHRNHVHAGKVTRCMVFSKTGSLISSTPLSPQGLCVGESGEHGTFTAIRGKATSSTSAGTTGTVIIRCCDSPAFAADVVTLFTLVLDGVTEVDDTGLDNAWPDDHIWIQAYCSVWNVVGPQDVRVQFFFTEAVWA